MMQKQGSAPIYVSLEFTPNPNTLKYSINQILLARGTANYTGLDKSRKESPLATALLETPGISGVMIGKDFITITKGNDADWDQVHLSTSRMIEEHLGAQRPVFEEGFPRPSENLPKESSESDIERKIREILDRDIRPAVAMDGGDIIFNRYEDGTVYLEMHGSCSGCPSSTATLKMGIETRLKAAIPEIQEVVSA